MNIVVKNREIKINNEDGFFFLEGELIVGIPEIGQTLYKLSHGDEYGIVEELTLKDRIINAKIRLNNNQKKSLILIYKDDYIQFGQSSDYLKKLKIEERKNEFLKNLDLISSERVKELIESYLLIGFGGRFRKDELKTISKFGGTAIINGNFVYPRDNNGKSLLFIGQVSIDEIIEDTHINNFFPVKSGILYFFSTISLNRETEYIGNIVVKYSSEIENLDISNIPTDLENYGSFQNNYFKFFSTLSLPDRNSGVIIDQEFDAKEKDDYELMCNCLNFYNQNVDVRFLEHPLQMQNCPAFEAEMYMQHNLGKPLKDFPIEESEEKLFNKWMQLLHFSPYDDLLKLSNEEKNAKFYLPEISAYVMIKKEDFNQMDFSNTQIVGQ
jgi:uncharacterized protein YwqG